ncbi:hypothetical protein PUN28_005753 [Cardiocondyla obscurior]|uniref:Uncharacterized protein n=1 Tax=Cardiocondyla obscurior TaxID=286306 RepID=A0AAW2G8C2_9HYME
MAWKTAVEKNLFGVVLSNVGRTGRDTLYIFNFFFLFFTETRKKYTLNSISRHAVSDITPKTTSTPLFFFFFIRSTAPDSDSMNDSVRFTIRNLYWLQLKFHIFF